MRQDMTLRMTREGSFAYNPEARSAGHCGIPLNLVLHYRVMIETSPDHLDENGFIIDNNAVHDYFLNHRFEPRFWSCEEIAMRACEYFVRHIAGLKQIEVSISGNPNAAWLTSCWKAKPERKRNVKKKESTTTLAWSEAARF